MFLNSPLIFIIFLIQPHTPSSPSSIMSIGAFGMCRVFIWPLAWPSRAAESGKTGAHCLTPSRRLRKGSANLRHRRSRRTAQGTRRATTGPTWFWVLLPKQKDLVPRFETAEGPKNKSFFSTPYYFFHQILLNTRILFCILYFLPGYDPP